MALEEGGRVDFTRLRHGRRQKLFDGMDAAGLEVLVLGRPANAHYASGARQLWRTGAHPFAPLCVVIRATEKVHLLSSWDDGVPPEIGHEDLFGLFWNPAHLIAALAEIPGFAPAHRVGTDSLTPFFGRVLHDLVPALELVDASPLLAAGAGTQDGRRDRRHRGRGVAGRGRTDRAGGGLATGDHRARARSARICEAIAAPRGAHATERERGLRHPAPGPRPFPLPGRRPAPSDTASWWCWPPAPSTPATRAGWRAPGPPGPPPRRRPGVWPYGAAAPWSACWCACRAGNYRRRPLPRLGLDRRTTGRDRVWRPASASAPRRRWWASDAAATAILEEGAVLSVQAWVSEEGTGGFLQRELVQIGEDGPKVLTRSERSERWAQ